MSDLGLANRYPVTMGRGVGGGASPGLDVDSIRDGLLHQPFGTNINIPPSPLQQILAGQPVGGSPGLPQMPGSTGAGILAAGPDVITGASARPPGYVVGGANALGEAANANAQVAGYPTMPAYQPMTAAPYPTPSFAPIPDRGPDQQVPGSIGAFSALASLFSGPYAGAINAAPLEASHALADQQYKDSLTRYQMA